VNHLPQQHLSRRRLRRRRRAGLSQLRQSPAATVAAQAARQSTPAWVLPPARLCLPGSLNISCPIISASPRRFKDAGQPYPQEAQSLGLLCTAQCLLAQADIRFLDRRYDLDYQLLLTALVPDADRRGAVR
jgi:hypothetical protein